MDNVTSDQIRSLLASEVLRCRGPRVCKPAFVEDPETGCWNWQGGVTQGGYGIKSAEGRRKKTAHAYMWQKANGPLPPGTEVHHRCRNRRCGNPAHLQAVTRREHAKLMGYLRISELDFAVIKALSAKFGLEHKAIGELFGIARSTVTLIINGKYPRRSEGEVVG